MRFKFGTAGEVTACGGMGHGTQPRRWEGCRTSNLNCDNTKTDTHAELVTWIGGRVYISPTVSFTFRLGHPSLLLGFSFFL